MTRRPPPLQPLPPSGGKGAEGGLLEISETMTLVLGDGKDKYVVNDAGVERTPHPHSTRLSTPHSSAPVEAMLGQIKFDQLQLLEVLGQGSQGRVRKVLNKATGQVLAMKSIPFSSDIDPLRKALIHELERITAIKHQNVVSSYEAYFRDGKLYIVMEFMDCGTCADLIKRHGPLNDEHVSYIARHVVTGMAHLHAHDVVHRDTKPANMLSNSAGDVKISDFGVAGDGSKVLLQTNVGSTPYMSPERIKSEPYTKTCDIWSTGLSIAEMALGAYPFGNVKSKFFELCQIIASGTARPLWSQLQPNRAFHPDLIDFVDRCLQPSSTRPTADQLLLHPFLDLGRNIPPETMGALFLRARKTASPPATHTAAVEPSTGSSSSFPGSAHSAPSGTFASPHPSRAPS